MSAKKPIKNARPNGEKEKVSFSAAGVAMAGAVRWGLFLGLWWVLSGGVWREGGIIVAISFVGGGLSLVLCPPGAWRLKLGKIPGFALWFLGASFLGGLDVARRAFSPSLPMDSVVLQFSHTMTDKESFFFAWVVSLLPGTVCLEMKEKDLRIHSLDKEIADRMESLEKRIQELFRG
ncbi:MAG: Na+/H+ antiporter subunit E [Opitutales bacterium]|nr:Na+/H+ antiporter subunit E [Opitutales bacterium]